MKRTTEFTKPKLNRPGVVKGTLTIDTSDLDHGDVTMDGQVLEYCKIMIDYEGHNMYLVLDEPTYIYSLGFELHDLAFYKDEAEPLIEFYLDTWLASLKDKKEVLV